MASACSSASSFSSFSPAEAHYGRQVHLARSMTQPKRILSMIVLAQQRMQPPTILPAKVINAGSCARHSPCPSPTPIQSLATRSRQHKPATLVPHQPGPARMPVRRQSAGPALLPCGGPPALAAVHAQDDRRAPAGAHALCGALDGGAQQLRCVLVLYAQLG